MSGLSQRVRLHICVVAFFTFLTIIYFINFNPLHKIAQYIYFGDALQHAWAPAWFCHAVTHGLSLFDANILAPLPNSLAYSEGDFGVGVQSLLLWIFSRNATLNFNILTYLSFVLAGYGMFLFIREIYPQALWGALFGGIVFAFNAARGWRVVGHLTILQIHWLPFAVLFLLRSFKKTDFMNVLAFGLFSLLIFLSNFYLMVIVLSFYFLFIVLLFLFKQYQPSPKHLMILFVLALDSIIMIPFLIPYTKIQDERFNIIDDSFSHSADLPGYLLPPTPEDRLTSLTGLACIGLGVMQKRTGENMLFLGYIALILVGIRLGTIIIKVPKPSALQVGIKIELSLLIVGFIFAIMSFGVRLSLKDYTLPFNLPFYYMYRYIPALRFIRAPARFGLISLFAASCVSGICLHILLSNIKHNSRKFIVFILVTSCAFITDYYLAHPIPTYQVTDNSIYRYLRAEMQNGQHFNILVLPTPNRQAMLFSTFHWHSVLTGNFFPGTYLQDLKSFLDFKPSIALLLEAYDVDCIISETPVLTEKLKQVDYLKTIIHDANSQLFLLDKNIFKNAIRTQAELRQNKFSQSQQMRYPLMDKDQIDCKFKNDPARYEPLRNKGWFRILKSPASILADLSSIDPYKYNVVEITMSAKSKTDRVTRGELYWKTAQEPFLDEKKNYSYKVILDGEQHTYRLELSNNYQWLEYGQITAIRFDLFRGRDIAFEISDISLLSR